MTRIRIFLLMFLLGLNSVPFFNGIYDKLTEIPVNLPEVKSAASIIVFPANSNETKIETGYICPGMLNDLPLEKQSKPKKKSTRYIR